jgi:hypothetical protein
MGYSVQERAECLGTFRWIEIQLMEMLARWVPTTPEMEAKVLFGRHVWDCAQHADAFGKRAFELRAPLHYTLPAADAYRELLRDVAGLEPTASRISAFYETLCPGLAQRYRDYIAQTDSLMDEPTVRILERALQDFERMAAERDRLGPAFTGGVRLDWGARDQAIRSVVAHGDEARRARGMQA